MLKNTLNQILFINETVKFKSRSILADERASEGIAAVDDYEEDAAQDLAETGTGMEE